MRDNTQDFEKIEVRWEVMKSLLDSSPELWNRAEEYVVIKRHEALVKCSNPNEPDIERLLRQILMDCKREHLK